MIDVNNQYAAWARNGPPVYMTMAIQAGFKPANSTPKEGVNVIDMTDPDAVEEAIRRLENGG